MGLRALLTGLTLRRVVVEASLNDSLSSKECTLLSHHCPLGHREHTRNSPGFWTASVTGRPGWCPSPTNYVRSPLHDDVSYASSIFPVCTHFAVQLSCHFNDIYILRLLIHAWATQLIRNVLSLPWIPPPAHSDDDGLHVCGGGHVGLTKEEIGLPGGTFCGLRACGSGQSLWVDMRRRGV